MAFLDPTIYDMTTEEGQGTAISDLIDEMNAQNVDSELLNYFNISTYGLIQIPIPVSTSGTFTGNAKHGAGYKPAFSVLFFDDTDPSNTFYSSMPYVNFINSLGDNTTATTAWCDNQNIYASIFLPSGLPSIFTAKFFYYIFNLPMPT